MVPAQSAILGGGSSPTTANRAAIIGRMSLTPNPESHRAWQERSRARALAKPGRGPNSSLARVGARSKRLQPALEEAYAEVDRRDGGRCQFHLAAPGHRCSTSELHHDHLFNRNVRPDLRQTAWNIVLLCAPAHRRVTDDPKAHRALRVAVLAERIAEWIEQGCPGA